jgi:hypothetical protein
MKKRIILSILLTSFVLFSCIFGDDDNGTTPTEGKNIGMSSCYSCHITGGIENSDGKFTEAYKDWMYSHHGNFQYYDSATYTKFDYEDFLTLTDSYTYPTSYNLFIGFPNDTSIAESIAEDATDAFDEASDCLACHGPSSTDNSKIATLGLIKTDATVDSSNKTQVARPVIGCESCHGPGEDHQSEDYFKNTTSLTTFSKTPTYEACGQCHNSDFPEDHLTYHPTGAGGADNPGIHEAYIASPHFSSINDSVYVDSTHAAVTAKCSKCHTDEGAKTYKDDDYNTYSELETGFASESNLTTFNAVQCRTCHNSHNPDEFLEDATLASDGTTTIASSQFNTCTNCHQLAKYDSTTSVWAATEAYHNTTANTSNGGDDKIITDTHWFAPNTSYIPYYWDTATSTATYGTLVGTYVTSFSATDACSKCHNPHSSDTTIHKQWAESAHGNPAGDGWTHYDWKDNGYGSGSTYYTTKPTASITSANQDRTDCQRCHTSTGFVNYTDDPTTYLAAMTSYATSHDRSILPNTFTATYNQAEMLYCNACHKNNAFDRRSVDAVNLPKESQNDTVVDGYYQLPDLGDSNICINCHSGRETGYSISSQATPASGKYYSLKSSHYLTAGETMFRLAYQYSNLNYNDAWYFAHADIGTSVGVSSLGSTSGPCVTCHMKNEESHTFEVVTKDTNGTITAINSFDNVCSNCHSSSDLTIAKLQSLKTGLSNALDALKAALQTQGIYFNPETYPYFYTSTTSSTSYSNWTTKEITGAAFNLSMVYHEPGAYVHNSLYTRRIVFDSIDYADNNTLNGTINLSSYANAAEWFQADGITTNDGIVTRP